MGAQRDQIEERFGCLSSYRKTSENKYDESERAHHQYLKHGPLNKTGQVGAPLGEPPLGSRLTASVGISASAWSAPAGSLSAAFSTASTRPSERGAPSFGRPQSSRLLPDTWMEGSSVLTHSSFDWRPAETSSTACPVFGSDRTAR